MLADDGTSLSLVARQGFKRLVQDLDPRITVRSRQGYVKKMAKLVKTDILPRRRALLNEIDKRFCHFTCDIWTSKGNEGILCIMCHFIHPFRWTIEKRVLLFEALKESHSGVNIRSVFLKCLSDYKVQSNWVGQNQQLTR